MSENSTPSAEPLHSLRSGYLFVATLVCILLISGAIVANWYARDVSRDNAEALELRNDVTESIGAIRSRIWKADNALNAALIFPRAKYKYNIVTNLDLAKDELALLAANPAIEPAGLSEKVQLLRETLSLLTEKVQFLMVQRQDPNWTYPLLPFINQKLLEPHNRFESAASRALKEIAGNDGRPYASPLYGEFDQLRDLWRSKVLNFRAVVIRFAGLNNIDVTPQEQNISDLHQKITERLAALQKKKAQDELGTESAAALEEMQDASESWQANWAIATELRSSSIWRADIQYMETDINRYQQQVFNALAAIERTITTWSAKNIDAVQQAANQISNVLWGLAGVALAFVILVYLMIDRSILRPIAGIAEALSTRGEESLAGLENRSSREIHRLIAAFNVMRHQVHQRQMALEHQTLHDALTGLPNRVLLQDRLEQSIQIMKRNNGSMSLLLLDLDRFKEVNDALGHQVGDELLQQVGQRLEALLRDSDTVARLGGDEFAIVAPDTDNRQAALFSQKIARAIKDVFQVGQQNLYVGVSIGVAVYPQHGTDAGTLIRHADIAMYNAKRNNLDYRVYEVARDKRRVDKLALVGDLHEELENTKHLQLYYQPQIDLSSHEMVAVEALLRWSHPQRGAISPEQIIKMAEHTGLIAPLTQWVIDTTLSETRHLRQAGKRFGMAVNLSAWNLQDPELPAAVAGSLEKYAVPAGQLTLEITESAMMSDPVRARKVLMQLSGMGVNIAIDDFGTGFSSLGYLKMLPVNDLKIDKSFVISMGEDENDAIIVHSTIELAHNLGLNVIAEGVENQRTLSQLQQQKCDMAQGFHIAAPLPGDALQQWLQDRQLQIAH
ncbi:MAG: EAL domain-containing protein [Thiogranum sp.]